MFKILKNLLHNGRVHLPGETVDLSGHPNTDHLERTGVIAPIIPDLPEPEVPAQPKVSVEEVNKKENVVLPNNDGTEPYVNPETEKETPA